MAFVPKQVFHRCLAASAVIHALALIAVPVRGRMSAAPPPEMVVTVEEPPQLPEPEPEEPPQERQIVEIAKFRAPTQVIPRREPARPVEPVEEPEAKAVEVALLPPPTVQDLATPPAPPTEERPLPDVETAELPEARPEQMAALPDKLVPEMEEVPPEPEAGTLPEAEAIAQAPQPVPLETPEPPDMEVPGPELEGPAEEPLQVAALPSPPAPSPKKQDLGSGSIEKARPELGLAGGEVEGAGPEGDVVTVGVPREQAASGPQDIGSARPASVAAGPELDFPDQPGGPEPRLGVQFAALDAPGAAKGDGLPAGGFAKATPTLGAGGPDADMGGPGTGAEIAAGPTMNLDAIGDPVNIAPGPMGTEPIAIGSGLGGTGRGPSGGGPGRVAVALAGGVGGPGGGRGGSGLALGSGVGKGAPRLGVPFGAGEGDAHVRRIGLGGEGPGGLGGGAGGGPGGTGAGGRGTGGPRGVAPGRAGGGIGTGPEAFGFPGTSRIARGTPGARGLVPGLGPGGGVGGPGAGGPNAAGFGAGRGVLTARAVPGGIGDAVGEDRGPVVRLGGGGGTGGTSPRPGGPGRGGPLQIGRDAGGAGTRVAALGPGIGLPPLPPVRREADAGPGGPGTGGGPGPPGGTKRTLTGAKARPGGLYVDVSGIFDMPLGITTSDYNADASGMPNLLSEVRRRTDVDVTIRERFVSLELDSIKDSPVIHLRGHKAFRLTPAECEVLRKYVQQGGTIFGEDSHGPFGDCFRREMRKVFGVEPRDLPKNHELYKAFYVLDEVPRGDMGEQHPLQGITVGKRLGVVFSRNDYGDLWEGTGWWVQQQDREAAYKIGVNIYAYITAHWNK